MSFSSRKYFQQLQHERLGLVPEEDEEEEGGDDHHHNHLDGLGSRKSSLDSQDSHFLTGEAWARQVISQKIYCSTSNIIMEQVPQINCYTHQQI
jgi:hypothetical protein